MNSKTGKKGASYRSNCSCPLQIGLFKVKENWEVPKEQKKTAGQSAVCQVTAEVALFLLASGTGAAALEDLVWNFYYI